MPNPSEQTREQASTYFVQDRSNLEEMARLDAQDQMLNAGMGGVLPELDVGQVAGSWRQLGPIPP